MPKLVALETDHEMSLSEKAHRVLRLIESKDAQMINNRISDGILGSFEFQKKVYGTVRCKLSCVVIGVRINWFMFSLLSNQLGWKIIA